jgi:tripartite-type tricarboxylate transporter receptor subunit TctC
MSLLVTAATSAQQTYPTKPLRLLVPFTPGGAQDVVARLVAHKVGSALGARIVVDNRAGAGGLIATQEAARATPDAYTMLLSSGAQMAIEPSLKRQAGFDPLRDFVHVVHLGDTPLVLLAAPGLAVSNVKELVAYSKSNRDKVNTASTGTGTYTHLTLELFKIATGADLTHVPYKGASPAFTDLLGSQVQTMFTSTASAAPNVAANRVKALAVTSAKRTPMMPNVPTFVESGVPIEVSVWLGIAVPAGTPRDRVERLNAEFNSALRAADVKERLAPLGVDTAAATSATMTQFVRNDVQRWAKVIKTAGIRAE